MRHLSAFALISTLLFTLPADAQDRAAPTAEKIVPLPRDLEVELALSALPQRLQGEATVYVLNPEKGFEVARQGTNGFSALVARTGDDAFKGSWPLTRYRSDILYPVAFDRVGAKAQMQVFLDAAAMQARGVPSEELKRVIQDRFRTGEYKAPERAGVSFMLSPVLRTYVNADENDVVATASYPHVMYYAPDITNEDVGGGKPGTRGAEPFVILHGHHGYMIQPLGVTESAAITRAYEPMLARLCAINALWCLPNPKVEK